MDHRPLLQHVTATIKLNTHVKMQTMPATHNIYTKGRARIRQAFCIPGMEIIPEHRRTETKLLPVVSTLRDILLNILPSSAKTSKHVLRGAREFG